MKNRFKILEKPFPKNDIREIILNKKMHIPDDYVKFINKYNVAVPLKSLFMMDNGKNSIHVDYFFGISESSEYNIYSVNEFYFGRLPYNMIAIAKVSGDNLICININTYKIYYWDHELNEHYNGIGEPLIEVAQNIWGFIDSLVEFKLDESKYNIEIISVKKSEDFDELFKDYFIK